MDTNDKLVKIIEYKKLKGSIRKPKYATRKLSIGLVSCMLGYALLVSPTSVEASEVDTTATSVEEPVEENLTEAKTKAKEDIDAAFADVDAEKASKTADAYKAEVDAAETQEDIDKIVAKAEAEPKKSAEEKAPAAEKTEEEKDLEAYKVEANTKIEEALNKLEEGVEPSKSLEDYKKDVEAADSKEAVDEIVNKALAEKNNTLQFGDQNPEDSNQQASKAEEALPKNRTEKTNWEDKVEKGKDHWELGKSDKLEDQRLVRVTTSDPIEMADINYQGSFVDGNGRTNLRMVYMEKSAAISSVWKKAEFNFGELYDKIDFEKSYAVDEKGNRYSFSNATNAKIKTLNVSSMISLRTQNKNNIPINIVLKDGTTINDLNNQNYKVQMRLVDKNNERVYSFAPGKSAMDYSTYTKSTSVSLGNNIESEFNRGPKQKKVTILQFKDHFYLNL